MGATGPNADTWSSSLGVEIRCLMDGYNMQQDRRLEIDNNGASCSRGTNIRVLMNQEILMTDVFPCRGCWRSEHTLALCSDPSIPNNRISTTGIAIDT